MFASAPLEGNSTIGSLLSDYADVYLWRREDSALNVWDKNLPSMYNNCEVYTQPPKHISVAYAAHNSTAMNQTCFFTHSLWFPVAQTMHRLCRHVMDQILYVPLDHPSLRVDYLDLVPMIEAAYGKTSHWVVKSLFKQGQWQKLEGQSKGKTWDTVTCEEFGGREICFDVGLGDVCLAEQEAGRRNNLWTIKVKYEDEKKTGRSLPNIVKELKVEYLSLIGEDKANDVDDVTDVNLQSLHSVFSSTSALHVDMDCNHDVNDLKSRILSKLLGHESSSISSSFPMEILHRIKFRTGHKINVGVLDNEDFSLKESFLYHDAILRLQIVDTADEVNYRNNFDGIEIRFCLVNGNDSGSDESTRMGKHNPTQPGTRSLALTLPLNNLDETLTEMKQRALQQLFSLTKQGSDQDNVLLDCSRRMRKTNWADECTDDLLFEVARSSSKDNKSNDEGSSGLVAVTVGSALSSGSLKDNELVLLEEGEVPDRDSLYLEIFLWPPSHSAAGNAPPPPVSVETLNPKKASLIREEFEAMLMEAGDNGKKVHPDMQAKFDWLPQLGKVKCSRHSNLQDLYEACYAALVEFHENERNSMRNEHDGKENMDNFPFIRKYNVFERTCMLQYV